jgi:hypothetical protein
MSDHRLWTPRVEVLLDTGELLEVQCLNADLLAWDRTASKHGWPSLRDAPIMWMTFIAWSALRRTGQLADVKWEDFSERRCEAVRNLSEDEGTDDGVDPTPQSLALG